MVNVDRFCLLAGVEALAADDGGRTPRPCASAPTSSPWEPSGLSLGPYAERDRLPRRPRESAAATGSRNHAGKEHKVWRAGRCCATATSLSPSGKLNLMVLNVFLHTASTYWLLHPSAPEGDLAKARGDGTSKSAVSRDALTAHVAQEDEGLAAPRTSRSSTLLVIQIDGLHVGRPMSWWRPDRRRWQRRHRMSKARGPRGACRRMNTRTSISRP